MRLGLFGGTFDPVHYGHLLLAECCREQCQLDEVWFLPAATPPHKQSRVLTSGAQRIEMLQLAVSGHEMFRVCPVEIERGGVSFTVDTLAELSRQHPGSELFFLLGADSLEDLPHWREPARLCQLAVPVAVSRPGAPTNYDVLAPFVPPERLAEISRHLVKMPQIGLSSREIRNRTAAQRVSAFAHRAVEKYIETHQLYRHRDEIGEQ